MPLFPPDGHANVNNVVHWDPRPTPPWYVKGAPSTGARSFNREAVLRKAHGFACLLEAKAHIVHAGSRCNHKQSVRIDPNVTRDLSELTQNHTKTDLNPKSHRQRRVVLTDTRAVLLNLRELCQLRVKGDRNRGARLDEDSLEPCQG